MTTGRINQVASLITERAFEANSNLLKRRRPARGARISRLRRDPRSETTSRDRESSLSVAVLSSRRPLAASAPRGMRTWASRDHRRWTQGQKTRRSNTGPRSETVPKWPANERTRRGVLGAKLAGRRSAASSSRFGTASRISARHRAAPGRTRGASAPDHRLLGNPANGPIRNRSFVFRLVLPDTTSSTYKEKVYGIPNCRVAPRPPVRHVRPALKTCRERNSESPCSSPSFWNGFFG